MSPYQLFLATLAATSLLQAAPAWSQSDGFAINRYQPTTAGEASFSVDHPWYRPTRDFAAGLTFNYNRSALVYGPRQGSGDVTLENVALRHQALAHLDLAGSVHPRVTVSLSLPITLAERGTPSAGFSPLGGATAGDPRFGVVVRLHGEPDRDPFSVSASAQVWIPIGLQAQHAGDRTPRVLPKVILGGLANALRWSLTCGFYYRAPARVGELPTAPGNTVGPELQLGGALYYTNPRYRFSVGPEVTFGTVVVGLEPFRRTSSAVEVQVLGAHWHVTPDIQLSAAWILGVLREPGTPAFRFLFRIAYAPTSRHR